MSKKKTSFASESESGPKSNLLMITRAVFFRQSYSAQDLSGKTSEKILQALKQNNKATISELASQMGLAERSIERNIQKLQQAGTLRRRGGRKAGYWEVLIRVNPA